MSLLDYLQNLFFAPSRPYRFIPRLRAKPQERKSILDIFCGVKKEEEQTQSQYPKNYRHWASGLLMKNNHKWKKSKKYLPTK